MKILDHLIFSNFLKNYHFKVLKNLHLDRLILRGKRKQLLIGHTKLYAEQLERYESDLISYIYGTAKSVYVKCSRFVENSSHLLCPASYG